MLIECAYSTPSIPPGAVSLPQDTPALGRWPGSSLAGASVSPVAAEAIPTLVTHFLHGSDLQMLHPLTGRQRGGYPIDAEPAGRCCENRG
jgi:hypothetical protein